MLDTVKRPAGDILGRRVRLTFGGQEFVLPTLTIAGNERWRAELDGRFAAVMDKLEAGQNTAQILSVLSSQVDDLIDLLRKYDTTNVLPDDLKEIAYEDELITAVREVWRAANPLVGIALRPLLTAAETNGSSPPTNSPRPNTAGRRRRSGSN